MPIYGNFVKDNLYDEATYDYLEEAYFKTVEDIRYNKEAFDSGKINLCFITGFSGSGKSTLGAYLSKEPNVEWVDMDKVVFNQNCNDPEKIKALGTMYQAYFETSKGKEFHNSNPAAKGYDSDEYKNYTRIISISFFEFAKQFAKAHKNTKFIVEGVWLYRWIDPSKCKDYAVYIKGTSAVESSRRAVKRDIAIHTNAHGKAYAAGRAIKKIKADICNMKESNKGISKYINYFTNIMKKN